MNINVIYLASTADKKSTDDWIRAPANKKPPALPHHMQTLLGIVGGILGFILLAVLFKKCYWDKRNGEGDAYNSVQKFKDKNAAALSSANRPNNILNPTIEVEPRKVAPHSDDSGVSTGKSNTNKSQKRGYDNKGMKMTENRQPIEKPIAYIEESEINRPSQQKNAYKKSLPKNANTFDAVPRRQSNPNVDDWVAKTYDERIHRKTDTVDSNVTPPGYYDGMTPEEIEREKRRRERRRRHREHREDRGESRHKSHHRSRHGEDREEKRHRRQHRRR